MPKVYLAGPIAGYTWEEATAWRHEAERLLPECECLSPLRGKGFLKNRKSLPDADPYHALSSQHAIVIRDRWDVRNADAIIANFQGARHVSIGTCFELAWAKDQGTPVIVVMDKEGLHDHAFIKEAAYLVVDNLEHAVSGVRLLFGLPAARDANYDWEKYRVNPPKGEATI